MAETTQATIAEDRFVTDIQIAINTLMEQRGMSRSQLAKSVGLTEAGVDELFDDEPHLTAQMIARIFHALGETPELTSEGLRRLYKS